MLFLIAALSGASVAFAVPLAGYEPLAARQLVAAAFPEVTDVIPMEENRAIGQLYARDEPVGYVYQTLDFLQTPAYSGKPLNIAVVLDLSGVIVAAHVIEHHEPILLVGIPESRLHDFTAQYTGLKADQRVTVGGTSTEETVAVDGLSGATVTVMVVNEVIMKSAHRVGAELGLVDAAGTARPPAAEVLTDRFEQRDWQTLAGDGSIRRLALTRGQADDAFRVPRPKGWMRLRRKSGMTCLSICMLLI